MIFHCLDGTQFTHHLRKEVWLLPGFGDREQSCGKHLCAGFCYECKFSAHWVMVSFFLFKSS